MKNVTSLVRGALAHRARCRSSTVRAWHRPQGDLHLTPVQLLLLALELEDAVGVELPTEELASVETVGDLFVLVTRAAADERPQREAHPAPLRPARRLS